MDDVGRKMEDPRRWFVIRFEQKRHISASLFIAEQGFKTYLPTMQIRVRGTTITRTVPRFGVFLFAQFDVDVPGWQALCHSKAKRAGIVKIMCSRVGMRPLPVPTKAMEAIRAYEPMTEIDKTAPYLFRLGEPCMVYSGGQPKQAVFVEYCGKGRARVRTWILGAERIAEAPTAALEPLPAIDSNAQPVAIVAS